MRQIKRCARQPAQHPGGFSHHSAPTSLHRPVGASAGARAWTAVTLRLLLVLQQVAPCDSQEGTPQRAPAGRRLCRAASHRGTSTRAGHSGVSQCSLASLWDPKSSRAVGQGSRERQCALAAARGSWALTAFCQTSGTLCDGTNQIPSACLTRGPEAGAERQMNQP